ncbi:MAG: alpha/beta-type small acid-soluble spore protein [Bacillota bacterium]|nr:alpha/beta-type small acid-soluble spore protein [Bacillota bacterium]
MAKEDYRISELERIASTKTEIADELGIEIPKDRYWGNMSSKLCGTVGGAMGGEKVREAVESFERNLLKKK